MSQFDPNIHHRRSIRLKGYDYAQAGLYFVTLCVQNQTHLFGEIIDGEMKLNYYGKIAEEEWLNTLNIRDNIALAEHIIMPNHIHGIIEIKFAKKRIEEIGAFKSPSQTIGAIIRGYKGATTKKIKILIRERIESYGDNISEGNRSTGELQFAPTEKEFAPTAPIAPTEIDLSKSIWQRDYYEHIIRNEKAYQNISNYIINNPKKWEEDKFFKKHSI